MTIATPATFDLDRDQCHRARLRPVATSQAAVVPHQVVCQESDPLKSSEYQTSPQEQTRVADLLRLLPHGLGTVLDIGARDGFITRRLTEHAQQVTALDLELPVIEHPHIACVKGDATALEFDSASFDLVFCAEVLEHIPGESLARACAEIARVSRRFVLIGVPYRQDLRLWRTTCHRCNGVNPPWAHVNAFDESRLHGLFPGLKVEQQHLVGIAEPGTNAVSAWLMDRAGNPYGTYVQDEGCVHCGAVPQEPARMALLQRALSKLALGIRTAANLTSKPQANWMHLLFSKQP